MALRRGLDLRQLQVFLAVAANGSVTSAAQSLGISQAAASQQIARLEERLGVALFDRRARHYRPTTAGARLLEEGQKLVDGAAALSEALEAYRSFELPNLQLYVLESLATLLVPPLVSRLRPRVGQLDVHCALQLEREHDLIFDKNALAITSLDIPGLRGAGTRPILCEPFVAVVPAGRMDEAAAAGVMSAQAAATLPFIRFTAKRRMAAQVEAALDAANIASSSMVTVDSSPAMLSLVAAGSGWTVTTPSCLLTAAPPPEAITVLALGQNPLRRRIVLIADDDRLAGFPEWIAGECHAILEREIRPSLDRYATWLAPMMQIGTGFADG